MLTALPLGITMLSPLGGFAHAASPEIASPHFSITGLGVLPGGTDAYAFGINQAGDVAGRSSVVVNSGKNRTITTHAFLYRHESLIDLGAPGGSDGSLAFGLNSADDIAAAGIKSGEENPYVVSVAGGHPVWKALATSSVKSGSSLAYSIDDGGTVGGAVDAKGAAKWTRDRSGNYSVNWLDHGSGSVVAAVDGQGDAAGYVAPSGFASGPASLWLNNGKYLALKGLDGKGAEALGIVSGSSGKLRITGSSIAGGGRQHATTWVVNSQDGKAQTQRPVDLGVPNGFDGSAASGINTRNWAVGYAWKHTTYIAVLWVNGRAYPLNELLPKNSGWNLMRAQAINASGQIAGWGSHQGELRPFLLTPG